LAGENAGVSPPSGRSFYYFTPPINPDPQDVPVSAKKTFWRAQLHRNKSISAKIAIPPPSEYQTFLQVKAAKTLQWQKPKHYFRKIF
jgi:hypothetical protein